MRGGLDHDNPVTGTRRPVTYRSRAIACSTTQELAAVLARR